MGTIVFTEEQLRDKYSRLLPQLNERAKRLMLAADAKAIGYGGVSLVHRASGVSRVTITKGLTELDEPPRPAERIRLTGGGRKKITHRYPRILAELELLVEPVSRGDPQSPLRWTTASKQQLAEALEQRGYEIGASTVGYLLREALGYSLQSNKKRYEGKQHADRDQQFAHITKQAAEAIAHGNPVLSIDTKKKELVGNFKNNGKEWRPKGKPEEVNAYDFLGEAKGKAIPYGIYDLNQNEGFVNIGTTCDTATFAVASLRLWWQTIGEKRYRDAQELMITVDCGGSNSNRARLWKWELQQLANEIHKPIRVCHFPPGTSKWNKIEHRLFCHISLNWRGKPLLSYESMISLIGATTTKKGLRVSAQMDWATYQKGIKVTEEQFKQIHLVADSFHPEWNYMLLPTETTQDL